MPRRLKKEGPRTYVLDTSVLVHDPDAIFNFEEHDIVVPITVVEELDGLKSGNETRNVNARRASRNLMKLIKECGTSSSISLGNGKGNLSFFVAEDYPTASVGDQNSFRNIFMEDCADHRIIAIAYMLKEKGKSVVLVTKDNNVFIKATALGIKSEDYIHDMVKNPDRLDGKIKGVDPEYLQEPKDKVNLELYVNQPVMVKDCCDGQDRIYRWKGDDFSLIQRKEISTTGIKPMNLEQDFAVDILMDTELSAIALIGAAGSGKTLLAIACAVAQKYHYPRILVARPAIELSDKTMGFLPGDLAEKYNPYLAPVRSACRFIMDKTAEKKKESDVEKWMDDKGIELLPLSMIRGDTFHHAFILVDEAQNLTPNEVKTIVSRAGENTKIVFTGDINQIDVRYLTKETNGLSYLIDRFRGQPYFASIEMQTSLRSPLAEAADKLL